MKWIQGVWNWAQSSWASIVGILGKARNFIGNANKIIKTTVSRIVKTQGVRDLTIFLKIAFMVAVALLFVGMGMLALANNVVSGEFNLSAILWSSLFMLFGFWLLNSIRII